MKPELGLRHEVKTEVKPRTQPKHFGYFLELSPEELTKVLKQSRQERGFPEHSGEEKKSGDYLFPGSFMEKCRNISREARDSGEPRIPQFVVDKDPGGGYKVAPNPEAEKMIEQAFVDFRRGDDVTDQEREASEKLISTLKREREWLLGKQKEGIDLLLREQGKYLETGDAEYLCDIGFKRLGESLGISESAAFRVFNNLFFNFPDGRRVLARDLVPGNKSQQRRGIQYLKKLRNDPRYFDPENNRWMASARELAKVIGEEYGLALARETVQKYRKILEKKENS
ncbi:MAG: hypothetical protein PHU56_02725 [Candidatus Pacebacteria bacterium]|nr:hypothetical protein [Candidatus Paceibacterota bacterium]